MRVNQFPISVVKILFFIGMSGAVLYASVPLQAQDTSGSGLMPSAESMPYEYDAIDYGDYGAYGLAEPRRKPKPPLAGVTEVHIDSPQPVENYVESVSKPLTEDVQDPSTLVEVEGEPYQLVPGTTSKFKFADYRARRNRWGVNLSIGMSAFRPAMVENNRTTDDEPTDYSDVDTNLLEFQVSPRVSFLFGALSLDLGVGQYFDSSKADSLDTQLILTLYRAGVTLYLDNLFREPILVPYASTGFYQFSYSEQGNNLTTGPIDQTGSTDFASYVAFGINLQLNWLDRVSAQVAYQDLGLENGFLFAEARQLMNAGGAGPDLSSKNLDWSGGVRVEF